MLVCLSVWAVLSPLRMCSTLLASTIHLSTEYLGPQHFNLGLRAVPPAMHCICCSRSGSQLAQFFDWKTLGQTDRQPRKRCITRTYGVAGLNNGRHKEV